LKPGLKYYFLIPSENYINVETIDKQYTMLANFITSEIQGTQVTCEEILQAIMDVEQGKMDEYDTDYGNACRAEIIKGRVSIDDIYDEVKICCNGSAKK
jgi:hypothetical protein